MNIVFTGPAIVGGEHVVRSLLTEAATDRGHHMQSMVGRSTDYLVMNPEYAAKRNTRKQKAAKVYGVPLISPDTFLAMLMNGSH